MISLNKNRNISIHIVTDMGLSLDEETNQTFKVRIKDLFRSLDELYKNASVILSHTDSKVLIANNGKKLISLTIKENDINWNDILNYKNL